LNALLRSNVVAPPPPPPPTQRVDLIDLLVHSFLVWEATLAQADAAMTRIRAATVSFNDFRVSLVKEVVDLIGPRYPLAQERAIRVRATINDLFRREHAVSLERIAKLSKRDGRIYLEGLQGMVPFVSARVSLLGLDAHAIPVDEQTLAALGHHGVLHAETTIVEATSWLQRHIPAEKALAAHLSLQKATEALSVKLGARGMAKIMAAGATAKAAREAEAAERAAAKVRPVVKEEPVKPPRAAARASAAAKKRPVAKSRRAATARTRVKPQVASKPRHGGKPRPGEKARVKAGARKSPRAASKRSSTRRAGTRGGRSRR